VTVAKSGWKTETTSRWEVVEAHAGGAGVR
jgi:hypothetical protein